MSWRSKYKFFRLAPHCSVNYGHEWEVYKLNSVFKCINEIIQIDKEFHEKYGHVLVSDIPKEAMHDRIYKSEQAVIKLGRELNGPLFKSWRTLYPDRFTAIKKLYKKLRNSSMQYCCGCNHLRAETIGQIIENPTKDMFYIIKGTLR